MAGMETIARHFPFWVGRDQRAGLRLEGDGVWERHAEFQLSTEEGIELVSRPEAFTAVGGLRVERSLLRNGDIVEVGGVKLQFALSPARRKSLWVREALTWAGLAALTAFQVALVSHLLS
jgi:hypothetical protein